MAKIIPSNIKPDEFHNSYGEYQIYKALSQLPDDYIVFYSLHWSKKEKYRVSWGESDFTIFHPKRGILVIEAKSGEIYCKDGEWSQVNSRTKERKNMKDPMVQAERSKYTFIDLLEKNINSGREYRVECAVWFTMAESYNQLGTLPPNYSEGNLLIKKDLNNIEKAIRRVFDYYNFKENSLYDKNDEISVIRTLSPEFNVIMSVSNIMEEAEYYFNRMTREQVRLIEYLDEQRVAAIQGGAGTGKTMLAIEKARRLLQNPETQSDKVLFLCFNEFLYKYLLEKYKEELPNTYFFSMDKLVKKHYKIKGQYSTLQEKLDFLNNYSDYNWDYKHIIIDEGQDFTHDEISALYTIAEIEDSCFYVFYDKNQLVNKEGSISILSTDRIECRLVLSINCRNTKSIASSSNKILGIKNYKLHDNVQGTKPVFYIISKKEQILSKLYDEIKKYVNDGIPISKIVILTVKTENKSILAGHSKIGNYVVTHNLGEKGILFTTARKYKGLEAAVVILIDIEKEIFNDKIYRKVMHVGASRAKYFLSYITYLSKEDKLDICENMAGKKINEKNCNVFIEDTLDVEVKEIID